MTGYMEKQLEELKAKMERSAGALANLEKDLDVINPEEKTNVFSARLLHLDNDLTAAEVDRAGKEAAYQRRQRRLVAGRGSVRPGGAVARPWRPSSTRRQRGSPRFRPSSAHPIPYTRRQPAR